MSNRIIVPGATRYGGFRGFTHTVKARNAAASQSSAPVIADDLTLDATVSGIATVMPRACRALSVGVDIRHAAEESPSSPWELRLFKNETTSGTVQATFNVDVSVNALVINTSNGAWDIGVVFAPGDYYSLSLVDNSVGLLDNITARFVLLFEFL